MTFFFSPGWLRSSLQGLCLSMLCLTGTGAYAQAIDPEKWDLTPLEPPPDWENLEPFQGTLSQSQFQAELEQTFLSSPADTEGLLQLFPDHALIAEQSRNPGRNYRLAFGNAPRPAQPAFWRSPRDLPPLSNLHRPLDGLRIVVDPGHIGGDWAQMERRWFLIPSPPAGDQSSALEPNLPVREGDIALRVAELLEAKLTALGARVALTRRLPQPVTPLRPETLLDSARRSLGFPQGVFLETSHALHQESERLFYLSAEIRARGERVNRNFRPDLALCLHLNAESWGNPASPSLVTRNHFHILINGCYTRGELLKDDQRFFLFWRLLQRFHREELALAEGIAEVMAPRLGLPPYEYHGSSAKRPGSSPFVWSRNLLATRIYQCPVIYFEPYVMNDEITYQRIQAGEYPGTRPFAGKEYPNLYEEYAAAVADGIASYYRQQRPVQPAS